MNCMLLSVITIDLLCHSLSYLIVIAAFWTSTMSYFAYMYYIVFYTIYLGIVYYYIYKHPLVT